MNLDILKQQIEILRADLDRQGSLMQKDMAGLLNGMTGVIQALDARINSIEATLKINGLLTDKLSDPAVPPREGTEL